MEHNTFFEGSLQDGIALAIQQSKMVLAFVTDGGEQSQQWENALRTNESLKPQLESQVVALRLVAGSEEAGFLEALFPVPKKPTVVMIQNGALREYIRGNPTGDATAGTLVRRITAALNNARASDSQQTTPTPATRTLNQIQQASPPQAPASNQDDTSDLYDSDYGEPAAESSSAPVETPDQSQSSQGVQAVLAERAKRLEADKKAKEAKAKAEREARAKARREGNESNEGQSSNITTAERSYAAEVRQRKVQAAEERKRILKRIEDDKQERREREAMERQARLLSATQDGEGSSSHAQPVPLPRTQGGANGRGGDHCNLQVRLFDGSTIRSQFTSDATLNRDVRKWIDETRTDGDTPYSFRVVLTPQPNKAIDPVEEIESLLSLGLAPSATLVLVPAKYAPAYAAANSGGIFWRSITYVLALLTAPLWPMVAFFGSLFGFGGQRPAQGGNGVPLRNLTPGGTATPRIRGFRNQEDERRDAQLYNGNSLNFEPRRDEDGEDGGESHD
ncbi:hypothetical protein GGR54DRAFT_617799 [Hypoxylon sp. NC1633]|nr:hypothetical protein GGR54DRAFT_617799 [Hypoxylon sp. NC1633]